MNEKLRKIIHISFGLPIILIPILPWWVLLLIASAALIHNIFLFPIYASSLMRNRFDRGIIYYPFSVLLLILLLRRSLALAASAWALLSFADGVASLVGGKHPLPWNPRKTLSGTASFVVVGFLLSPLAYFYVMGSLGWKRLLVIEGAVFLSALFESLDLGFDDNLIVPFSFVVFFYSLSRASLHLGRAEIMAMVAMAVVFLASVSLRLFSPAGNFSALAVGTGLVLFGGWKQLALLFAFLIISEVASFYKKGKKGGVRRTASSVWGKGGPALLFSLLGIPSGVLIALAQATFDTVATEIGSVLKVMGFSMREFRPLPSGKPGVWTTAGTIAGLVGMGLFFLAGIKLGFSVNLPLAVFSVIAANTTEAHFKACTTPAFANFLSCLFAPALYLTLISL